MKLEEAEKERKKKEEQARQEELQRKRREAELEEQKRRQEEQELIGMKKIDNIPDNKIQVKEMASDELYLLENGNRIRQENNGAFNDQKFNFKKAMGEKAEGMGWEKVKDLDVDPSQPAPVVIFDDGVAACEFK